jgi:hypothetical protein
VVMPGQLSRTALRLRYDCASGYRALFPRDWLSLSHQLHRIAPRRLVFGGFRRHLCDVLKISRDRQTGSAK